MRSTLSLASAAALAAAAFPLADACAGKHYRPAGNVMRRQDIASSGAAAGTSTAATATATATGATGVVAATAAPSTVPLESIGATMVTVSLALSATPTAGQQPSITNAPVLPSWTYTAGAYPTMDVTPPTDSDEVKEWIAAIDWDKVPDYTPNTANADASLCTVNADASADTSRCWWSCGQCTDETDVVRCPDANTWGLTFDDGPSISTPILLDFLTDNNIKATFFIIGSRALGQPDILRQEHILGHAIGGHTWSHTALTTLTNEEIVAELGWTRKLIYDILGVTTLTFRPPQGDIDNRVRAIASQMNLQAVMWTDHNGTLFDTQDWGVAGGSINSSQAFSEWKTLLDDNLSEMDNGFLTLSHDLMAATVDLAVYHILPDALSRSSPALSLMSVQECQGQSIAEAYLETAASFLFGNSTETSGDVVNSTMTSSNSSGATSSAAASSGSSTGGTSAGFAQLAISGAALVGAVGSGVALFF